MSQIWIEELVRSLQAHEMRMKRGENDDYDQALLSNLSINERRTNNKRIESCGTNNDICGRGRRGCRRMSREECTWIAVVLHI